MEKNEYWGYAVMFNEKLFYEICEFYEAEEIEGFNHQLNGRPMGKNDFLKCFLGGSLMSKIYSKFFNDTIIHSVSIIDDALGRIEEEIDKLIRLQIEFNLNNSEELFDNMSFLLMI